MRRSYTRFFVCCAALAAGLVAGCGGRAEPRKPAADQAAPSAEKAKPLSASKRMLGKWKMDIDQVPDTALTKELLELKKKGLGSQIRAVYTVTDREFIMNKSGAGGPVNERWFYEVLKEDGDSLLLQRTDSVGQTQQIPASMEGDRLRIGTGNGIVPLERVAP